MIRNEFSNNNSQNGQNGQKNKKPGLNGDAKPYNPSGNSTGQNPTTSWDAPWGVDLTAAPDCRLPPPPKQQPTHLFGGAFPHGNGFYNAYPNQVSVGKTQPSVSSVSATTSRAPATAVSGNHGNGQSTQMGRKPNETSSSSYSQSQRVSQAELGANGGDGSFQTYNHPSPVDPAVQPIRKNGANTPPPAGLCEASSLKPVTPPPVAPVAKTQPSVSSNTINFHGFVTPPPALVGQKQPSVSSGSATTFRAPVIPVPVGGLETTMPPAPLPVPQQPEQSRENTNITLIPQLQLPPANTPVAGQSAPTDLPPEPYSHYRVIPTFREKLIKGPISSNARNRESQKSLQIVEAVSSSAPLTVELLGSIRVEARHLFRILVSEKVFHHSGVKTFYALMIASNVFANDIRYGRDVELAKTQLSDALTILEYAVFKLSPCDTNMLMVLQKQRNPKEEFNDPHIPHSDLYCLINALRATLPTRALPLESGSYFNRIALIICRLIEICSKEKLSDDLFAVDDVYRTNALHRLLQAFADAWKTKNAPYIWKIQELLLMITEKFEDSKDQENSLEKKDQEYIQKIKNLLDKMNVKKGNLPEAFSVEADIEHELNEIMKQRPDPIELADDDLETALRKCDDEDRLKTTVDAISETGQFDQLFKSAFDLGVILQYCDEEQCKAIVGRIIETKQFDQLIKSASDLRNVLSYCDQAAQCKAVISTIIEKEKFDDLFKSASDLEIALGRCNGEKRLAIVATIIEKGKLDELAKSVPHFEIALSQCNGENRVSIVSVKIEQSKLKQLSKSASHVEIALTPCNGENRGAIVSVKIEKSKLDKLMQKPVHASNNPNDIINTLYKILYKSLHKSPLSQIINEDEAEDVAASRNHALHIIERKIWDLLSNAKSGDIQEDALAKAKKLLSLLKNDSQNKSHNLRFFSGDATAAHRNNSKSDEDYPRESANTPPAARK